MARFLVDAQLPPQLAEHLRRSGHQAEHVVEHHLLGGSDREIARLALEIGAILITKDSDFIQLAHFHDGPPVLWIRLGNTLNRALWQRLEPLLADIVTAFEAGEIVVEVR